MGFAPARRFDFFSSQETEGCLFLCFFCVVAKNGGRAPRWAFCCPSPSVFDSSCYSVVCMLYTFSAPFPRQRGGIEIEPTKLKSVVVVVVVSSRYRELSQFFGGRGYHLYHRLRYCCCCCCYYYYYYSCYFVCLQSLRFFFTDRKKVLEYPRRLLVSSPPSEVVVVPVVVVVVRIVIVHSAVHSKLWVPFND